MRQSNCCLTFFCQVNLALAIACREEATKRATETSRAGSAFEAPAKEDAIPRATSRDTAPPAVPPATGTASSSSAPVAPIVDSYGDEPEAGADHYAACYEGFAAGASAEIDATRLGLLCGPSNGMVEHPEHYEGTIDETGAEGRHVARLRRGDCFRVFGSAEAPVDDLEIEVRDPRGERSALVNLDTRWIVVPDKVPLCVVREGAHELIVRTHGGRGRYVLKLWTFPRAP